jgi:hypothetical protein
MQRVVDRRDYDAPEMLVCVLWMFGDSLPRDDELLCVRREDAICREGIGLGIMELCPDRLQLWELAVAVQVDTISIGGVFAEAME